MNVQTVVIPKEEALEKLTEFRNIAVSQRRAEDADFRRLYKMASKGHAIIDVQAAFHTTGLNEKNQPLLAMARADWQICYFHRWQRRFSGSRRYRSNGFRIPNNAWNWNLGRGDLETPVPFLPPTLRPTDSLTNYWILFEVKDWQEYSADPFLLKRVSGWLYAVIGEWELTDLERSLLSGR
jgi:hypothetical protein